jgi:LysM repeat protein
MEEASTYIVQPGDTLQGVALKHKLKVNELKRFNKGIGSLLFTGQVYETNKETTSLLALLFVVFL